MAAGDMVVKGTAGMTEQPLRRVYRRDYGWATIRTWIGPKDYADALASSIATIDSCEDVDLERGFPAIVRATFPDVSLPTA